MSEVTDINVINLNLSGYTLPIRCPLGKEEQLNICSRIVDDKLREARKNQHGSPVNNEQLLLVTAINLAYECLQLKNQTTNNSQQENQEIDNQLEQLILKIDSAITKNNNEE